MNMILRGGQAVGVIGVLLMALGVLLRLVGQHVIAGFESVTLLIGGIGAVGAGCFALLWVLTARGRT